MSAESRLCEIADRLRKLARACPNCGGRGTLPVVYIAHRVTNVLGEERRNPPRVEKIGVAQACQHEPCLACRELRQLVDLAEGY